MKSPTEIHSDSAIELQVYHLIKCYHNFCIMSLLSKQQSFPLQVKRICRDSSFVTLMSFSAKLSSQIFLSLFRIPRQNSQLFSRPFTYCEAIRHVISVESWPSNHVWKSGCIHSNEISCNESLRHYHIHCEDYVTRFKKKKFVQIVSGIYKKAQKVQILNEVALIQVVRNRVSFQDRKNENKPKFPSIKIWY